MTILIIVLIILLVLSIINNYYMYQYNYNESCPTKYIYNTKLPENVKFSTITFFYKDKTFKIIRNATGILKNALEIYKNELEINKRIRNR